MFNGSIVALVTPMQADGSIDKKSLYDLVDWHLNCKTDALVIAGTTGEGSTLSKEEQFDLISTVVSQVAKRMPIIAGTGSLSTQHTLELTFNAKKAGADAALIVTPYYNKPTQQGLYEHYKIIAEATTLPIILYNVPSRTACDLLPETVERLSKLSSIIGIKEATGKLERAQEIISRTTKQFAVYSGDDMTAHELLTNGARGVISVTANIVPSKMHDFCNASLMKDYALAEAINNELMPLHKVLFLESNPIPVKWALHELKRIPDGIRLPLIPLDIKNRSSLKQVLLETGVINES